MDYDTHKSLMSTPRDGYGYPIKPKRSLPAWAGIALGLLTALTILDALRGCAP